MPELKVKITADASQYSSGVRVAVAANSQLASQIQKIRAESSKVGLNFGGELPMRGREALLQPSMWTRLGTAIGAVAAGIAVATRTAVRYADEIQNAADRTGMSVDAVQEWSAAAKDAGLSIDSVATAFKRMKAAQSEGASGNKEYISDFAALGVSVEDLRSMSPEQLFDAIANRLGNGAVSGNAFAASLRVLGKQADEVAAIFNAKSNGGFLFKADEESVKFVDSLGDSFGRLFQSIKAASVEGVAFFRLFGEALGITPDRQSKFATDQEKTLRERTQAKVDEENRLAENAAAIEGDMAEEQRKNAEDVANYRTKIEEERRKQSLAKMTPEEKRAFLTGEQKTQIGIMENFDLPELERVKAQLRVLQLGEEIAGLDGAKTGSGFRRPNVDSLTRIGLFVGSAMESSQQRTVKELQKINTNIRQLVRTVETG